MNLQEEMFALISDWKQSKLLKHQFLKGKGISKDKFGYWLNKFNKQKYPPKSQNDFKEVKLPEIISATVSDKLFELTTPSGYTITVFEV